MRVRTLVLHAGLHRTATALVQHALAALRPQLHAHGVAVLTGPQVAGLPHEAGWARRKDVATDLGPKFAEELRALAASEFDDAAARAGRVPRTLLLSSEQLTGGRPPGRADRDRFRPHAETAVRQVVDALEPDRVQVVLSVRRQDRLMESSYAWDVQRGRFHPFAQQFPNRFEPVFSYVALAERLLALPRVERVRVRPFELVAAGPLAYVDDFLGAVQLQGRLDLAAVGDDPPRNAGYSRNALRLALAMNPHLDTERERALVRAFLQETFPSPPYPEARIIPKKARQRIIDAYREDNEQLFARHMPDLPRDAYGSIDATTRLGAVAGAPAPPAARRPPSIGSIRRRWSRLRRRLAGTP